MIQEIILFILSLVMFILIIQKRKSKGGEGYEFVRDFSSESQVEQYVIPDDLYLYQILPGLGMIDFIRFSRGSLENERIANKYLRQVLRFANICDLKDMKYYSTLPTLPVQYPVSQLKEYPLRLIANASYIILKEAMKTVSDTLLSKKFINNGNDKTLPEWVIFNDIAGNNLVFYPFTTTSIELASQKLNQLFNRYNSVVILDNFVNDYRIGTGLMLWLKIDDQNPDSVALRNYFTEIHNSFMNIQTNFVMPNMMQVPEENIILSFPQNFSSVPVVYKGGMLYRFYLIVKNSEGEKGYQNYLKYKEMIKEKDLAIQQAEQREIDEERTTREEQLRKLLLQIEEEEKEKME